MRTGTSTMLAAIAAIGLAVAPAAHAQPRHWRGGHPRFYHRGPGPAATGALVGLGVGALIGGAIVAAQQPYYAPPPVAYPPPGAYAPPGAYYAPPGY